MHSVSALSSSVELRYHRRRKLTLIDSGMLISVTSLLAGRVGDIYGRRMTLLSGALIFTIGGLIQVNFLA